MMKKAAIFLAIPAAALVLALSSPVSACVGKTLIIGCVSSPSVSVAAEMMSILITERTGTTVVVKYMDDYKACYDALKKNAVDIVVDYTGRCYIDVLGQQPDGNGAEVFARVKEAYQRDMNLIWLEPLGFTDQAVLAGKGGGTPAVAAPVVRKDTLAKFPALPRVINKLAGKLDNGVVSKLATEGGKSDTKKVTRKFLKDNRLI